MEIAEQKGMSEKRKSRESEAREERYEAKQAMNITKKDICSAIADSTGLTRVDTQIIVEALFDAIRKTMQDGHNIELRGFGRFKIKPKAARKARNVRTGAPVQVPSGFKLVFQASRELRKRINDKSETNLSESV